MTDNLEHELALYKRGYEVMREMHTDMQKRCDALARQHYALLDAAAKTLGTINKEIKNINTRLDKTNNKVQGFI